MGLLHIPVRILAEDPAETQAFQDVMTGGQGGVVALCGPGETPMAALVCPSGDPAGAGGLPCVVLGSRADAPEHAVALPIPARFSEVLEALENAANATSGFSTPRDLGGWHLDPARLTLRRHDEKTIQLTETEARLAVCLFDAGGAVLGREMLLARVWGYRPGLDTHTLETHIYRLRKKIEGDPATPAHIITDGDGYRFAP